ncbi:MAG: energy transducer TonB [Gammaproteobacteria bacterium]|nr:energy transducer TonB [Gammaproteobacteria bacterium]PCH63856.1 MAG: energy transducer TonB [Gammaproteobacteria bacterium]
MSTSSHSDHLTLTLFFALLLHAFIILGISFSQEDFSQIPRHTMDITLVHQESEQEQNDAKILAQANQDGGNETEREQASSSPSAATIQPPVPSLQQQTQQKSAASRSEQEIKKIAVKKDQGTVLEKTTKKPAEQEVPLPSADELIARSMAMASLSSEIGPVKDAQSNNPRRRLITTKTREFRDAFYFESWRKKIEKIGNLNYPEEARRRNLAGKLRLDVGLFPDGSIESITVVKSSGKKLLDDAAIRIVKLAAPFSAFPEDMRGDTDVLVISRVWEFGGAGGFSSR